MCEGGLGQICIHKHTLIRPKANDKFLGHLNRVCVCVCLQIVGKLCMCICVGFGVFGYAIIQSHPLKEFYINLEQTEPHRKGKLNCFFFYSP